ncbi:MAG: MFS transporter [Sulfobacillus thermotolerans]|nr:MFS transporter [Sulfobacillus thermotolerans]
MKPVTRLFLIATGWTLASYMASNFVGAWFWDIGTGLRAIILFYALLFAVMIVAFAGATRISHRVSARRLMTWGIWLNVLYLALLLVLKTHARTYYIPLALLEGLSASFYWLALFVLAASWVPSEQSRWYNAWTGTLEAILGLVVPPLSGWIIASVPGITGYRIVFAMALLSLMGALILIIGSSPSTSAHLASGNHPPLPKIPYWQRLLWSFGALGLRDGLYFFLPNLVLYILTRSTLWLGLFIAGQSVLEGGVFWALARWPQSRSWSLPLATALSALVLFIVQHPLSGTSVFVLGMVIGLSYPPYKVALEASALTMINEYSRDEGERIQLTGIKEVWINVGRFIALLLVLAVLWIWPLDPLQDIRWVFGIWIIWPIMIWRLYPNKQLLRVKI